MSIFTTPEQREAGRANFDAAVRRHAVSRRDFMKGLLAAGAAVPVTAAAYYGYQKLQGNPVKAGLIGAGDEQDRILSIGHQRHYSLLYAHAVEVINSGELGDIKYIRALWHRNNSWPSLDKDCKQLTNEKGRPLLRDSWRPPILKEDRDALEAAIRQHGYKSMDELVRWRLYNRTGGGLMAELGSHQLDACSIFLGKVHPLAVHGFGGKLFFGPGKNDRNIDDHVFVTYEFPGKNHPHGPHHGSDKNDQVVMTYSSISTN